MSDSPGLVDFAVRVVDFAVRVVDSILHLPDEQVKFSGIKFEKIQISEEL